MSENWGSLVVSFLSADDKLSATGWQIRAASSAPHASTIAANDQADCPFASASFSPVDAVARDRTTGSANLRNCAGPKRFCKAAINGARLLRDGESPRLRKAAVRAEAVRVQTCALRRVDSPRRAREALEQ